MFKRWIKCGEVKLEFLREFSGRRMLFIKNCSASERVLEFFGAVILLIIEECLRLKMGRELILILSIQNIEKLAAEFLAAQTFGSNRVFLTIIHANMIEYIVVKTSATSRLISLWKLFPVSNEGEHDTWLFEIEWIKCQKYFLSSPFVHRESLFFNLYQLTCSNPPKEVRVKCSTLARL